MPTVMDAGVITHDQAGIALNFREVGDDAVVVFKLAKLVLPAVPPDPGSTACSSRTRHRHPVSRWESLLQLPDWLGICKYTHPQPGPYY